MTRHNTATTVELDDLWEDMSNDELDDLEPLTPGTTPLTINKLSNGDADENLAMKVQPDGCSSMRLLSTLKGKVEE